MDSQKLEWIYPPESGFKPTPDMAGKVTLFILDERRGYQVGNFFTNNQGHIMGAIGDSFWFDRADVVIKYAYINHLLED